MSKKRTPYKSSDLMIKDDSDEEQIRTRNIFLDLKKEATKNGKLSELEKEFFCRSLRYSLLNDGSVSDFPCCQNYIFKDLYLTYENDITGAGEYNKLYKTGILSVPIDERNKDLEQIITFAKEWEKVIRKTNHQDTLLQIAAKEARETIKLLDAQPEFDPANNPFAKGSFKYKYKLWDICLYSKYLYLMALEILQSNENGALLFDLCGKEIEMNAISIIHILQRHYGMRAKKFDTQKTHFHSEFSPRELPKRFKDIFKIINDSNTIELRDIFKLPFVYKSKEYIIWIKEDFKQLKGQGNVNYYRISSFYPIGDDEVLNEIKENFDLIPLTNDLSIYKQKIQQTAE